MSIDTCDADLACRQAGVAIVGFAGTDAGGRLTDVQTTVRIDDVAVVAVCTADCIGVAASIGACGTAGGESGDVARGISTN